MTIDLDFNTSKTTRSLVSQSFAELVDTALESSVETPRDYLGASLIGDPCSRKIQYEFTHAPKRPHEAKLRRIFARGHALEPYIARWLRKAGFDLQDTSLKTGMPFGFSVAQDRLRGHVDGIILAGPKNVGLSYPCIWECKVVNAKGWRNVERHGVAKAYPKYADQVAVYQTYMEDMQRPALMTFANADTMEVFYEIVPFDAARAQAATDKAVNILIATDAGETLPRIAASRDDFPCKWCEFVDHCWSAPR
ncbi:MAG: hypothetical protein AAGH38_00510 [Pseudomonadota bacterium]